MAKVKGNFEAMTVDFKWNGKIYRVHPTVADSIKAKKGYSEDAPKANKKTTKIDK